MFTGCTERGVSFKGPVNKGNTWHPAQSRSATRDNCDVAELALGGQKQSGARLLHGSQEKTRVRCRAHSKYSICSFPSEEARPASSRGLAVTLTRGVFHLINVAFLKINSGRYGIEGLKNMTLSSFDLLSGGDGGQRILGVQLGSTGTMDLKEKRP